MYLDANQAYKADCRAIARQYGAAQPNNNKLTFELGGAIISLWMNDEWNVAVGGRNLPELFCGLESALDFVISHCCTEIE